MKKIFLFAVLFISFAIVANAQTVKTDDARKLVDLDNQIILAQKEVNLETTIVAELRVKYTDDYPAIKEHQATVEKLKAKLLALQTARKNLLITRLTQTLPDNPTELLRLIVIQNERIIDLLEKLAKIP